MPVPVADLTSLVIVLESDGRAVEEPRPMLPAKRVETAESRLRSLARVIRTRTVTPSADSISSSRLGSVGITTKPRRRTCGSLTSISLSPPVQVSLRSSASTQLSAMVAALLIIVNGKCHRNHRSSYRFDGRTPSELVVLTDPRSALHSPGAHAMLLPCNICVTCVTSDYRTSDGRVEPRCSRHYGQTNRCGRQANPPESVGDLTLIS